MKRFDIYGKKEYHENGSLVDADDHLAAIEALEARVRELEEDRRWIPVTEKLPDLDKSVLVKTKCGSKFLAYWDGDDIRYSHDSSCLDVDDIEGIESWRDPK